MTTLIVPRWSGTPTSDFYPWLAEHHDVEPMALSNPDAPAIDDNVTRLIDTIAGCASPPLLLGHSVGCQVVLRAAARWTGPPFAGALLVAAWLAVDEPWPTLRPWMDTPIDDAAVRAALPNLRVLISDDDPFTSDFASTKSAFERRFGATVRVEPGAKHFNGSEEPAVLDELRRLV